MLTKQKILDEIKEKRRINDFKIKTRHSTNPDRMEYAYDEQEIELRYKISRNIGERQPRQQMAVNYDRRNGRK